MVRYFRRYGFKRRRIGGYRKSSFRRRNFRRTFPRRRRINVSRRVRSINRLLTNKGIRSVETKYYQAQFQTPNTALAPTGLGTLLDTNTTSTQAQVKITSDIVRTSALDSRIGAKIFVKDLRFRGLLQCSVQANAVTQLYATLMFLRVKDAQGTLVSNASQTPYVQTVFEFIDNAGVPPALTGQNTGRGAFVNNWKYYHARYKDDFEILWKRTFALNKDGGSRQFKRLIKANIKVNKPAHWDKDDNWQDGHIFLYYWVDQVTTGDVAVTDGDRPTLFGAWRVTFTDV